MGEAEQGKLAAVPDQQSAAPAEQKAPAVPSLPEGIDPNHPFVLMSTARAFVLTFLREDGAVVAHSKGGITERLGLNESTRLRLNREALAAQNNTQSVAMSLPGKPEAPPANG